MDSIPMHIAIIPDGNRRWAKDKGLPTIEGHRQAADKTLPELVEKSAQLGIKYLTFWALSPENFTKRSKLEIEGIFRIGKVFSEKRIQEMKRKGVKVEFIGDIKALPTDIQKIIDHCINETKHNTTITLIIAVNYGGRDEIIRALHKIADISKVTKENFGSYLDTTDIPDPDLIIRTGGEQRLSGYLLWQSEYSEFYFTDIYFPDFKSQELTDAVEDFSQRQRRFGK